MSETQTTETARLSTLPEVPPSETGGRRALADGFVPPLTPDQLHRSTDLSKLSFDTTMALEPIEGLVGQARAADAIRFGTQIERPGFNLFVIGPHGASMQDAVKAVLKVQPHERPSPGDWVYVNNFSDPDRPTALDLPAGRAPKFRDAMHELIDNLKTALPAVFQSEDYQTRRATIDETFHKKQGDAFSALRDKAAEKNVAIVRTPLGFALAPTHDGEIVPPEEFSSWPEAKRTEIQEFIQGLEKELEHVLHQLQGGAHRARELLLLTEVTMTEIPEPQKERGAEPEMAM